MSPTDPCTLSGELHRENQIDHDSGSPEPPRVERLDRKGVSLRILDFAGSAVETRKAVDKLLITVFGAFAEFERNLMLERQRDGIAKAKAEGKYRGRAPTARSKTDE